MTGKPAARQDDWTLKGNRIIQGSPSVLIGAPTGVACSVCPQTDTVSNPVNPLLGAKVQGGEVDVALPALMPFILARSYSSYQTDTPAPIGLLGPGWRLPFDVSLLQSDAGLTLNDSNGRSVRFDHPLGPGEATYSRSENLWIVRGGLDRLDAELSLPIARLQLVWQGLHPHDRNNSAMFFATNNPLGPLWVFRAEPHEVNGSVDGLRLHLAGTNDRFGRTLRIARDGQGTVNAVIDGAGRKYAFEFKHLPHLVNEESAHGWGADSGLRLASVHLKRDPLTPSLPTEPLVRYEYTTRGELAAVFGCDDQQVRSFEYDRTLIGRMTAHAYAGRPPVRYVYNPEGKVVELHKSADLSYRFAYAEDSTTVTDSLDRTIIYHFEGEAGLRRVVKLEHPDGSITENRFDASGRQTASIDALGRETRFSIEVSTGNISEITLPDGLASRFDFNKHGQITLARSPVSGDDHMAYDELARLASTTNALGHTTRYHYADAHSDQPSSIEDARGGIKRLTFNAAGQLTRFTDCSGSSTHFSYDRWGQSTEVRGEAGTVEVTHYDSQGRITRRTNAQDEHTLCAYNDAGDLTQVTSPDGNSVRFERDVQGRLQVYHYGGFTQQFDYDEAGRLVLLINENGAHTTFDYDVMDRLSRQVNFDGRTQRHQYNAAGELTQSDDAGRISRMHYDKAGRLLRRRTGEGDDAPEEHFEYSDSGQLIKAWHVTELGGNRMVTDFVHDALGRIAGETQSIFNPEGGCTWRYSVERNFNEIGIEDQTTYDGLPAVQWQTYGSGHLHGVVLDGRTLIDFEHDKLHRETLRSFGALQTRRTYDALSRLSELNTQSPEIGSSLNRLHHYDPAGQLTRIDTAKGSHEYSYDLAGRLIGAVQPGHEQQHYRFDPAGNRLFENALPGQNSTGWAQTVRKHLHDKSFNLLAAEAQPNANDTQPKWMDNRIKDDGEFRYVYDAWGNLRRKYRPEHSTENPVENKAKGKEEHVYFYDSFHRLIRYTFESTEALRGANYHYDIFGRRLIKQVAHCAPDGQQIGEVDTTYFGWDGDRLVLTEKDARQIHTIYEPGSFIPMIRVEGEKGPPRQKLAKKLELQTGIALDTKTEAMFESVERELREGRISAFNRGWMEISGVQPQSLVELIDPLQSLTGKQIHLYYCDHLGTPLALINDLGEKDWGIELNAWGSMDNEFNPTGLHQPIRFQGQQWDEESGLHFNRNRFFNSSFGRYINQDPIGLGGGVNFFAYVNGNPLNTVDPLGLAAALAVCAAGPPGAALCVATVLAAAWAVFSSTSHPNTHSVSLPQPEIERDIWWPEKKPGLWSCKARADCNDNIPGNCPDDPDKRFTFGGGEANDLGSARNLAKSNATSNLGCQPKHVSCKCTGPKGERYSGGC